MDFDSSLPLHAQPFYLIPDAGKVVLHARSASLSVPAQVAAAIVEHLLPVIDGQRTGADVMALASERLPVGRAAALVKLLLEHGLVVAGARAPAMSDTLRRRLEPMRRHFARHGQSGWEAVETLRGARVVVVNLGASAPALLANLVHAGVGRLLFVTDGGVQERDLAGSALLHDEDVGRSWQEVLAQRLPSRKFEASVDILPRMPEDAAAWMAVLGDVDAGVCALDGPAYAHPVLQHFNAAAIASGTPWTLAANVQQGGGTTIGPTMIPGSTACHTCFEHHVKTRQGESRLPGLIEDYLRQGGAKVDLGSFAPLADVVANFAVLEVCDMLVSPTACRTAGKLLVIDPETYGLSLQAVHRMPRCPDCGRAGRFSATRAWS